MHGIINGNWGYSSVAQLLPAKHQVLSLTASTRKKNKMNNNRHTTFINSSGLGAYLQLLELLGEGLCHRVCQQLLGGPSSSAGQVTRGQHISSSHSSQVSAHVSEPPSWWPSQLPPHPFLPFSFHLNDFLPKY